MSAARGPAAPGFDEPVPAGGYRWWYLDALSDDGRHGITLIAFIGSVFSPYYARQRRRHGVAADPHQHCAMNIALYAAGTPRGPSGWAMTERGAAALERNATQLRIGPSAMDWDGQSLKVALDEVTAPWPSRIRGVLRVHADDWLSTAYPLDAAARHHWRPIAPSARVEVHLTQPELRWSGTGYVDSNAGARSLEQDFARWDWSRTALARGRSAVLYDLTAADGGHTALALEFDAQGRARTFEPPLAAALPVSRWGLHRGTRADTPGAVRIAQSLEDGPFYARSVLSTRLRGEAATAVHESLSLERFTAPWVQVLLPFRMPRRAG